MQPNVQFRRLCAADGAEGLQLFRIMAQVFDEEAGDIDLAYVERVLASKQFWAIAASAGAEIIGGITAHAIPMTNRCSDELFIYDLAVKEQWQRHGVGTAMVAFLRKLAHADGIGVTFVPASDEDAHAIAFYRAIGGAEETVKMFTFGELDSD